MIALTIRQMEYFEALAETAHFGRAADLAGVSQPALSAQIGKMERQLGMKLFERGGRAVRLTSEGVALRERVELVLDQMRAIEKNAARGARGMSGPFRLGIIPTVAPYLLPGLLAELRRRFPGLQVEIREATTPTLVDDVAARRLDALIAALPLERGGLVHREVPTVLMKSLGEQIDVYDIRRTSDKDVKDYFRAAPGGVPTQTAFSQDRRFARLDDDRVNGCIHDLEHADGIELLFVPPSDAGRKRFRLTTDRGTDCAVSLDRDEELVDGALLFIAPERAIIARFGEQQVWRLRPVDQAAAVKLGWNAGNLHWRVRFEGESLVVLLDAPLHTYRARIMPLLDAGEVEELGDV